MRLPSRLRALVLVSVVLDLKPLAGAVRGLTAKPRLETVDVGGVAVEIVRPGTDGPWPAWVFVNGAHPQRRREPVVTRLSEGLARAGYIVFVPDLPGLGEGTITGETLDASYHVARFAIERPDVRGGRAALIGASTGAGIALITAAHEQIADRISVVAAVAPFADLERMICLATTGAYAENGGYSPYEVTPLHRRVVARSLAATISDEGDRRRLQGALLASEEDEQVDPLKSLPTDLVSPQARAVVSLLRTSDPERFANAFRAIDPDTRAALGRLSPVAACGAVKAPVEIIVPPSDMYFPLGEAQALSAALPRGHLTVSATLDHTRPQVSVAHLRSLLRFDRFVMRGLRAAARD